MLLNAYAQATSRLFLRRWHQHYLLIQIFIRMKIIAVLLLGCCLQSAAHTHAQGIDLDVQRTPLKAVLSRITEQTGTSFLFTENLLQLSVPVTLAAHDVTLSQALALCFADQPLEYTIINETVVLSRKPKSAEILSDSVVTAQGIVRSNGVPLAGVSVSLLHSPIGTVTNSRGEFLLPHLLMHSHLVFSYTGYTIQEIVLESSGYLTVDLSVSVNKLDEAVVIAYGSTTKRLNTGIVSRITAKDIAQQPLSNPLQALEGRITGLNITQQTGVPGGNFIVRIRGRNSISNGSEPLYIVDGVPFTSTPINSNSLSIGITRQGNPLNNLNPSEIESIEVLKDADATAIYGSRGANGVILITTKKGITGATQLEVQAYAGIGRLGRKMDLLTTPQYLTMRHEAFQNDGATPSSNDYDVNGQWDTTQSHDWQKELLDHTSQVTDAQISLYGGNSTTQFRIGAGYHRETTVFPGSLHDQKASAHFQITNTSQNGKFHMQFTSNFTAANNHLPQIDLTSTALTLAPDAPSLYDPQGKLNWANSTWTNPLSYLLQSYTSSTSNLIANASASYTLFSGMDFKTSFGYTQMSVDEMTTSPTYSYRPSFHLSSGSAQFANSSIQTWIVEPQATYHRNIGAGQLSLLAGMTFQGTLSSGQNYDATGYANDGLLENRLAAADLKISGEHYSEYRYGAVFGRINYMYSNKYLINLTARRDGSSRFGSENRVQNFGSTGAAWIFSKENFIEKRFTFLSYGKFRASYGSTGSDQIPDYGYLDTYRPVPNPYQGITGLFPTNLYNAQYSWESNKKLEAAIELGFFHDRVLLTTGYYRNTSSNQLVGYSLAPTAGFASLPYFNLPATVRNSGWEIDLNTANFSTAHFSWSTNVNISFPTNTLVAYPDLASSTNADYYVIGQPLSILKTFHVSGINPQDGITVIQDIDHDGTISTGDMTGIANVAQKYYGGLQNTFRWKSLDLSFLIQFVKQTGYHYFANFLFPQPGAMGNQPQTVLSRWQQPGDQTTVGKFSQDYGPTFIPYLYSALLGDRMVGDASYIRFKNISVTYHLSGNWMHNAKLSGCKLFIQGVNLFTLTRFTGMDPETGVGNLPLSKIITAGAAFTF
jgi:TonB-linked SusC/RagA family outer membrane protein